MKQKPLIQPKMNELDAKYFLESLGYNITEPSKAIKDKQTNSFIINTYYEKLNSFYNETEVLIVTDPTQEKLDINSLKRFQNKAQSLNISKSDTNKSLLEIIDLLFLYAKDFNINPPKTFQLLLSKNYSWLFYRLSEIQKQKKKQIMEKYLDKVYNEDDQILIDLREKRESKILEDKE